MAVEGTTKRVTRRRVRTRANLLDAAFAVFAAKGFGRVSIEEVCEAAATAGAPSTPTSTAWTSCSSPSTSSART